ncbi:unnamed protein product [Mucor fragilis]
MISSNQSAFPEPTAASLFPDSLSYSIQENPHPLYHHHHHHHRQQNYHRQSYYHSPPSTTTTINSPLSSPQILNHYSTTSSPYCSFAEPYPTNHSTSSMLSLSSPSPPSNCLPANSFNQSNHINNASVIRYDVALEAPTAASQKLEEPPLTYLNKGQYYNINLKDKDRYDGDIISTVAITFHDENHRVSATDYWKFWLTQQKDGEDARAVEIDLSRSSGAQAIEGRQFDRVSFRWNGKLGGSVHIRFNCLSTDFSRIKGVKGIPLRLQIESEQAHPFVTATATTSHHLRQHHHQHPYIEKTYCRIKLFRDKGAERKTKMMQSILSVNWKNFEAKVVNRILYGLSFPQHLPSLFLASLFHLKTMKPITSNYIRCLMNETLFHLLHLSVAIFPIMHPAAVALVTISIYHRQFLQNAVSVI